MRAVSPDSDLPDFKRFHIISYHAPRNAPSPLGTLARDHQDLPEPSEVDRTELVKALKNSHYNASVELACLSREVARQPLVTLLNGRPAYKSSPTIPVGRLGEHGCWLTGLAMSGGRYACVAPFIQRSEPAHATVLLLDRILGTIVLRASTCTAWLWLRRSHETM